MHFEKRPDSTVFEEMVGYHEQPARVRLYHQVTVAVKPPYNWRRVSWQTRRQKAYAVTEDQPGHPRRSIQRA